MILSYEDWEKKEHKSSKRTLGIRDKQILFERDKHKCAACNKKIEFSEMQVGHKKAYSKGGATNFGNLVTLCYKCNKLQGTDSWNTFLKKLGKKKIKKSISTTKATKATKKSIKRKKESNFDILNPFSQLDKIEKENEKMRKNLYKF